MSVTSSIFLADWPEFLEALKSAPPAGLVPSERRNGPLKEATESEVITSLNLQTWWADVLEGVQAKLTDPSGHRFAEAFRILCWSSIGTPPTLDAPVPKDSAELVLSPSTAARLAKLLDGIEVDRFRAMVEPRIADVADGEDDLNFDLFKEFARHWVDVLRKAQEKGKGVVVIVWV